MTDSQGDTHQNTVLPGFKATAVFSSWGFGQFSLPCEALSPLACKYLPLPSSSLSAAHTPGPPGVVAFVLTHASPNLHVHFGGYPCSFLTVLLFFGLVFQNSLSAQKHLLPQVTGISGQQGSFPDLLKVTLHNVCLRAPRVHLQPNEYLFQNVWDLSPQQTPFWSLELSVVLIFCAYSIIPTFLLALVTVLLCNVSELFNVSANERKIRLKRIYMQ